MCFGKNDLRGEAPSGLNGDEKPPRISSHSSLSQDRSALPRSGKKNKLSAGDGELGESYEFVFPLFHFSIFHFLWGSLGSSGERKGMRWFGG